MKKRLLFFIALLFAVAGMLAEANAQCTPGGPVTTAATITVCDGTTQVDVPVTVTSFTNVGVISLKLLYDDTKLGTATLFSENALLWTNFNVVNHPGAVYDTITVSGYGPGITLGAGSTLFTLRFTKGSAITAGTLTFYENIQGTSCEYAPDLPPDFNPFCDKPLTTYYIAGGVSVVPDPFWIAYTFPTTAICTGGSVTFSAGISGGLGGIVSWIRSDAPGGTGTTVSSPDAPGIGTWYYRPHYAPTGVGCNLADGTETTVLVVADPVAPALTEDPIDADVCAGQVLTVSVTAGSGGTGTIADEYRYDDGSGFTLWSATVPSFSAVAGVNRIQSRRTATGTGCDESSYNEVSWSVVADPVAPALTKDPIDADVCAGQVLTVSVTAGSGGTGTIADEYRYDDGSGFTVWSATVPSFSAVAGFNRIQSRRTATGLNCNESSFNEVSWSVVADPVAPALTKDPIDADVCAGQVLTVSVTAGSGGTGTIADEYRYTTDNGLNWSGWSGSVPSITSVAGITRIQSRRTASGTGCDESSFIEVSWSVVADPVAPALTKNPTDADVCAGQVLTVSVTAGSGGTGTIADEYRFTTDNGLNWSGWSVTVPSITSVAGITRIQSRRTASGTGCDESSCNEVSWTVNARRSISGIFYYYNLASTVLTAQDITVKLYRSTDNVLMGTTTTSNTGYYEFTNLCPACNYEIAATSTHSTEGSVNTTDAAQVNYWPTVLYNIEKVRFHSGDVTGSPPIFINGSDAQRIQAHFVSGVAFNRLPWAFWRTGETTTVNFSNIWYPTVSLLVGSDATANMYGLCTGDFNRSFNPDLTKSASSTLDLIYPGNRQVSNNQEFDLPLRMVHASAVGAVSLILNFPADMVEVQDVLIYGAGGMLDWAVKGNELRIGWNSPVPLNLAADDELLSLRLKTTDAFTIGNAIRINLAANPLNELADAVFNVIGDAVLSGDVIEATAVGIDEQPAVSNLALNCYPNPFSNFTTISYTLPLEGKVVLEINNILGDKVTTLVSETQAYGNHIVKFDTSGLPSGVYIATLKLKTANDQFIRTLKLIRNK